jgi:hypothetical protein
LLNDYGWVAGAPPLDEAAQAAVRGARYTGKSRLLRRMLLGVGNSSLEVEDASSTTASLSVLHRWIEAVSAKEAERAKARRARYQKKIWKGDPISVGKVVGDLVHEQFVTRLPPEGFLATDVLDLYQGRGAFERTLADEDQEGNPDRWCSMTARGHEFWQIVWQWVWNLRLAFSVLHVRIARIGV